MTTMRFAVYLRISQDKALGTDDEGLAIDRQRELIRAMLKSKGHTTSPELEYVDNSVSATKAKARPAYQRMLKDWETGLFEGIAAYDLDRLTRKPREIEDLVDAAEHRGLKLATVGGDADLSTDNGIMFARIKATIAASETAAKGRRQRAANKQAAQAGKPYWRKELRPFGHNMDGTLHPEEAPALRAAVERVLDGAAITTVCRDLNTAKLKTNRGKEWHSTSLKRVLTSPRIAGIRVYEGVEYPGAWDAIVSPDTLRTLVTALQTRERPRKAKERENLLSGIAVCGTCGGSIGQSRGSSRLGSVASYRCSAGRHNAKNADKTDAVVEDAVLALVTVRDAEQVMDGAGADLGELRARRAEEVKWWSEQLHEAQRTRVPLADLAVYRAGHEDRLREIDAEILKAESDSLFSELWHQIAYFDPSREDEARAVWRALPLERKRRIVRALFREIVLLPGKRGQHFDPSTVQVELSPEGKELQIRSMLEAYTAASNVT